MAFNENIDERDGISVEDEDTDYSTFGADDDFEDEGFEDDEDFGDEDGEGFGDDSEDFDEDESFGDEEGFGGDEDAEAFDEEGEDADFGAEDEYEEGYDGDGDFGAEDGEEYAPVNEEGNYDDTTIDGSQEGEYYEDGDYSEENYSDGDGDYSEDDYSEEGYTDDDYSEDSYSEEDYADENDQQYAEDDYSTSPTMSPELQAEYDATFSGDERASNFLKITTDKFTRRNQLIKVSEIGFTEPVKMGRKRTLTGLTQSIKELGVVTPIHVMAVPEEEADDDYKYVLIDGMRRIFGAMKNGISEIDAVVWDFTDKDRGKDLLLALGLMLNRTQRRSWQETWDLYRVLEMQSAISPGTLEFLLQLEPGDAMKLKDVMLCEYSEVKEALLNEEKNLDGCYKMLQKLRKEEDQLAKDDATGMSDTVENAEELAGDASESGQLTDEDVMELLEMVDSMDTEDVSEDDFSDMNTPDDSFVDQQQVGDRHPLDPVLRNAVLARDDFTCKCCGMRMVGARLGLIAVHHVLPVHVGGKDTLDNLVTLCVGCHLTLHILERNGGTIMMSQDDFNTLLPSEQTSLKRALKLARIAIEADKRKGMSKQAVAEATKNAIKHPMPGTGLPENRAAYASAQANRMVQNGGE